MKTYQQVSVLQGLELSGMTPDDFEKLIMKEFSVRTKYLETIVTLPDSNGPGGRSDVMIAVHNEDISRYSVARLSFGGRWFEDVVNNSPLLYPQEIKDKYYKWD